LAAAQVADTIGQVAVAVAELLLIVVFLLVPELDIL
jgi:hypothetical protein